jgi:UDP-N-acetylglucosamine 2-epimerase (non-hydrolysing)
MTNIFFEELGIRAPDFQLQCGNTSGNERLATIITAFDKFINSYKPDLVIVPGDVDSSFACAFVASRYGIPVAHIESGLRSFDRTMPEELNRILIDDLSDLFFVSEPSGSTHLLKEGKKPDSIKFVGNTMIDSLLAFKPIINQSKIQQQLGVDKGKYILATLHRPSNVDSEETLKTIVSLLARISELQPIVFPIHPRTKKSLEAFKLLPLLQNKSIVLTEPLGYIDFLNLTQDAKAIITDSGGIQEESTFLQVPCFTLRPNTERPITVDIGTNELMELSIDLILQKIKLLDSGRGKQGQIPELWDGKASIRISAEINNYLH